MVKSERFAGFSGGENWQSEPGNGLFYSWKNTVLTGSREYLSDDVVGEDLEFSTVFRILKKRTSLIFYSPAGRCCIQWQQKES
jgi:hypothetical protein